jgi:hypothetical protein
LQGRFDEAREVASKDLPQADVEANLAYLEKMLAQQHYSMDSGANAAFQKYIQLRMQQPHFANARSIRNALERARLRQASRLFSQPDKVLTAADLSTLCAEDILASRVFQHPKA